MLMFVDTKILTYIIAFAASSLLAYGIVELISSLRRQDRKRIDRRLQDNWARATGKSVKAGVLVKDLTIEQKWALARWLKVSKQGISFQKICEQAALPWPAYYVLAAICVLVVSFLVLGLLLQLEAITLISGALVLAVAPFLVIFNKRNKRRKGFNDQMPEALELLSQASHCRRSERRFPIRVLK